MKLFERLITQGRQRNYLALFLSYFKTLSIGPDPGIELLKVPSNQALYRLRSTKVVLPWSRSPVTLLRVINMRSVYALVGLSSRAVRGNQIPILVNRKTDS